MAQAYARYSQAYKKAQVTTADQGRLVVMLYDGAIRYLQRAEEKIRAEDVYAANTNLIKGKSIIAELMASLNMEEGGDIAANLQRLYAYMFNQLIDANLNKDPIRVMHVVDLLKDLRQGWSSIIGGEKSAEQPGEPSSASKRISVQG